jgi:CMP/dCMP kinase
MPKVYLKPLPKQHRDLLRPVMMGYIQLLGEAGVCWNRPRLRRLFSIEMIITIDGPAGAGKSSVARALARRLGFRFLDTGAMYRAVALAGMRAGLDWDVPEDLARLARRLDFRLSGDRLLLDGEDVTEAVRTTAVTAVTRYAANNIRVREHLVRLQRTLAGADNVVTEGRDQGTVAFPDAQCKIFLTASPEERARRRLYDLESQGEPVSLEQVLAAQQRRDREDAARPIAPLVPAADAVDVCTDGMTLDEVVDRLEKLAKSKISDLKVEI